MSEISPVEVIRQVAEAVPPECYDNIIIVGSLAAGYQLLSPDAPVTVRTKDVDCILSPRIEAGRSAKAVAEKLIASGWNQDKEVFAGTPGNSSTPTDKLPIVRLHPPQKTEWFIELLTVPASEQQVGKELERIEISNGPDAGHYGLPSFRYLSLAAYKPVKTPFGILCARPEMIALANLLEHIEIKPERIGGLIEGRSIKRSNKDLGRVLAIARLSPEESIRTWPDKWKEGLEHCFPTAWRQLAELAGSGIVELLNSPSDFEEAHHACFYGLLSSNPPTIEQLRITGRRLIQDAVFPLRDHVDKSSP